MHPPPTMIAVGGHPPPTAIKCLTIRGTPTGQFQILLKCDHFRAL